MDDDYPPKSGIMVKYEKLTSMHLAMPIIRKLLGQSEYGQISTNTAIGRAVQRFVENDCKDVVCESGTNQYSVIE
jgi:hypothetical protein